MPIDLLAGQQNKNQPIDLLADQSVATEPTWSMPSSLGEAAKRLGLGALGVYSGAMNPVFGAASLVNQGLNKIPGVNLPIPQKKELSEEPAYQRGIPIGEEAAYMGATAIPGAGLVPTLGRVAAGGLYGAAINPESPLKGAAEGAVAQQALEVLPHGLKYISPAIDKATSFMRPKKFLKDTVKQLGGGETVSEVARSLASDIKSKARVIKSQYQDMIKPIEEKASGYNLYQSKHGYVPRTYQKTLDGLGDIYLGDAKELNNKFLENPTFENAHKLQSQLGTEARSLKGTDVATRETVNKLKSLRSAVKTDIKGFLNKQDLSGDLANQYDLASDFYLKEYIPYKNIKTIADTIGYKGSKASSLLNAFKNPTLKPEETSDILKVAEDLGEAGKNKILALELAKKKTSKQAIATLEDLDTSGLSEYATPTLNDVLKGLKYRTWAKRIALGTVGLSGLGTGLRAYSKIFGGASPKISVGGAPVYITAEGGEE